MQSKIGPLVLVVLILCVPTCLMADTEARPRSWMETTQDGQHVFVMLGAHGMRELELMGEYDTDVPDDYTTSGLYSIDDFSKPLYSIDWYAYSADVSADGRYVVRHGPWARSTGDLAVAFYDNGRLLREYEIGDLILMPAPWDHTVSHFFWKSDWDFRADQNELYVSTRSLTSFTFNTTTGEVKSSLRGDYIVLALLAALVVLLIYRWLRKRCKSK